MVRALRAFAADAVLQLRARGAGRGGRRTRASSSSTATPSTTRPSPATTGTRFQAGTSARRRHPSRSRTGSTPATTSSPAATPRTTTTSARGCGRRGSVQDKDDIENAFAAAYTQHGNTFAYFGLDRYQTSGDATAGFWFFKNGIAKTQVAGNGDRSRGVHAEGDILVVLDFSNGGATASAKVYTWHNGGARRRRGRRRNCDGTVQTRLCDRRTRPRGRARGPTTTRVPGRADTTSRPTPCSRAADLTALGLDTGCFSTFLAETRSSNTTTLDPVRLRPRPVLLLRPADDRDAGQAGRPEHRLQRPHHDRRLGHRHRDADRQQGHRRQARSSSSAASTPAPPPTARPAARAAGRRPSRAARRPPTPSRRPRSASTASGSSTRPATGSKYTRLEPHERDDGVLRRRQAPADDRDRRRPRRSMPARRSATARRWRSATSDAGGSITFQAYGPDDANCSGRRRLHERRVRRQRQRRPTARRRSPRRRPAPIAGSPRTAATRRTWRRPARATTPARTTPS